MLQLITQWAEQHHTVRSDPLQIASPPLCHFLLLLLVILFVHPAAGE
jgi:hypothetical protein